MVADRWINTEEFSQFEASLRAAYQMDWICASREVTPASKSGRRRSEPRARQMASPWLKRCALGRFTSSASMPASTRKATCKARSASPPFGLARPQTRAAAKRIFAPSPRHALAHELLAGMSKPRSSDVRPLASNTPSYARAKVGSGSGTALQATWPLCLLLRVKLPKSREKQTQRASSRPDSA